MNLIADYETLLSLRDLFQHLSKLDAILTEGLPDQRANKVSQQINRILERIQALGY